MYDPDIFTRAQHCIDHNDHRGFADLVASVMEHSLSYRNHQAGAGQPSIIKSAINKHKIDGIKDTTHAEYRRIYEQAQVAQTFWKNVALTDRVEFLALLEQELQQEATRERLVFAIAADVGKTVDDARKEITKAMEWLAWGRHADTLAKLPASAKPVGIVGVITSFNYPLALSIAGIVPAIISGNAVIFKCSVKSPHWAFIFKDAFDTAMAQWMSTHQIFQSALFSVISGRENNLLTDVDNLFFVGSTATGHKFELLRDAEAKKTGSRKNTHVELGGNAAVIVMDSAFDGAEDTAQKAADIAKIIFEGNVSNSGQRCTKAAVVIAQAGERAGSVIKNLDALYTKGLAIGNPFDARNKSGALVDDVALAKMDALIAAAKQLGASISGGGKVSANYAPAGGNYVNPALINWESISEDTLKHTIFDADTGETLYHAITHETFAPVLHVVRRVKDVAHAISAANEYDQEKLAAAIFANDAEWTLLEAGILATSKKHNAAPKDLSPWGAHGNWGHRFKTGGGEAFASFTS